MITRKHSMIVRYLSEKDEYVTALDLGKKLEVSTRTIKRYIKDLNYLFKDQGVEISSIKGVGYKLSGSAKDISKIVEKAERQIKGLEIDDSTEGRINAAICIMLNKEYISVQRLADELNLSIPSTNKLITNIKELLKKYDLKIISKPYYGSKIIGEELNIRYLILDTAIRMDEKENIKIKLENVTSKELKIIEDTISKYLKESNVVISDNDFNILMTRIIVSISRAKKDNVLKNDLFKDVYRLHNYKLIYQIMSELFGKLKVTFDEREILYVSNYSGVIIYNYNISKQFNENMAEEIQLFLKESLEEISLISGNDFTKDIEFINALSMHLKILTNRIRAGVSSKNPLLKQIKSNFPIETNLATFLANKMQKKFNVFLDEDEIGFITMHFGAASERLKGKGVKRICIICHHGIGTAQLLSEKIKQRMSDVEIVGVYPARYLDIAVNKNIDFIVSTIELDKNSSKVPIIFVENVFSDQIVNKIYEAFNEGEQRKKVLDDMFNEKAFFKIKAYSREEAIKKLGQNMKMCGFIDDEIIKNVLERENMSSTDIGHLVAIPHTIIGGKYKSIIGVGILDEPILWKKEQVQLVFMVCFNASEQRNFPVFKYLYNFIEDEGGVKGVIKFCDFKKLMKFLDVK